jgi:hypothetical protein
MSPFSPFSLRKQKHTESPPTLVPTSGLASSQVTQQLQLPTNSQSHLQSPHKKQQSQPVGPWSAHILPSGQWPSPFPRRRHTISTTATAAGELFLFGGYEESSFTSSNDLYVISTRHFSATLLQTSGDIPSPRFGHCAMFTSTILLIWGGTSDEDPQGSDDSFYLLNLGTSDIFSCQDLFQLIRVLAFQYRESGPASWSMVLGPAVVSTIP